jgi:hypothetical protein
VYCFLISLKRQGIIYKVTIQAGASLHFKNIATKEVVTFLALVRLLDSLLARVIIFVVFSYLSRVLNL